MRRRRVGLFVVLGLGWSAPVGAQDAPENLQFFDPDTPRSEVIEHMRQFSFALGVRCQYCHVGGDGVSFEGVDFASDDDPDKRKARYMLRMVERLNRTMLADMPDRDEPGSVISCKTCHRGAPKPELLTEALARTLDAEGPDAAVARYRDLRANQTLAGRYDFGEWEMNTLAEGLVAAERYVDAIAMYALNLEFYPNSLAILLALGDLHERTGRDAEAIPFYERVLEVVPGHERATARLAALRG
ncbi:MAG: c-type cytochrome [Gemmatimonadota bacterium]